MRDAAGELEGEAKLVAWMFLRVAKDGHTLRRVAAEPNERGALGVKWDTARVSRIRALRGVQAGASPLVIPRIFNRAQCVLASRRGHRVAA